MINYNEDIIREVLPNGLHVILVHKENYTKSHALFMTPFGALMNKEVDEQGNVIEFHSGTAHFLEHKMFEGSDKDWMDEFSKLGVSPNAYTTYNETCYFFTTSFDLFEPLDMLIEMVQNLNISDQSVEKEKGIIIQEYRMYQQEPDVRFSQELFNSLYATHPIKEDVVGDEESINAITVNELRECFNINYHPQNMTLVVIGGRNNKEVLEHIKENQAKKTFAKQIRVDEYYYPDTPKVNRENYSFSMDVNANRFGVAFKLEGIQNPKERYINDLALKLLLEMYFSSTNHYIQDLLDSKLINDSFLYDGEYGKDYGYFLLASETNNPEELEKSLYVILNQMMHDELNEQIFEGIKRRIIGNNIRLMNRFDDYAYALARANYIHVDFFDSLEIAKNLCIDDIYALRNRLHLDEKARILLEKRKNA